MSDTHFDLIVVGSGPGGYVGAIRAAQLGMKVACVERDSLGGVCLNWGCIPTKSLLANAELYHKAAHEADAWGLIFEKLGVDWDKTIGRSRSVAEKLNKGVAFLFKKNKITHIKGSARIVSGRVGDTPCTVEIHDAEVEAGRTDVPTTIAPQPSQTLTATNVLIATGAGAIDLPFARFDGDRIIGAREAMTLPQRPESMVIVGAGAIGMEFAYFYHTFGTKITIVEMLDSILPIEDADVSKALGRIYKKAGMDIRTGSTVTGVEKTDTGVRVTVAPFKDGKADESKAQTIDADKVLLAIGVRGRYDGLFNESLGLETDRHHIKVHYRDADAPDYATSVPGLYAIGDVIGPPWLAHVASEEAVIAVERLAGLDPIPIDYSTIPGCTYCHPQVASVGFTEQALVNKGMKKGEDYAVGKYNLQAHGKAIAAGANVGFVKIIRGLPRGEILGAHILGDQATEIIGEIGLARRLEATTEEIIVTVHAHPTMHEALREAALAAEGHAIHG